MDIYLAKPRGFCAGVDRAVDIVNLALKKYFYVKDFHSDFQIEWEKINKFEGYQELYTRASPKRAPNDI